MAFVSDGDFVGKFSLTTNGYETTDLNIYIERYEKKYLVELFGLELYELWFASVELPLPEPIYTKLKDAFFDQLECGEILESKGIQDMLLGFIYFHWLRDSKVTQTINGGVKVQSELSERGGNQNSNLFGRYNESIDTYKAIQRYILENDDIYPTFKGVEKNYAYLTW